MRTPASSIVMLVVAAGLGAVGQFLYKSGAEAANGTVRGYLLNGRILLGAVSYVGVMALFVAAFRRGGELTVLYPIYASTFVWAALIAWGAYGERITPANVAGMVLLIAGMYLLGR